MLRSSHWIGSAQEVRQCHLSHILSLPSNGPLVDVCQIRGYQCMLHGHHRREKRQPLIPERASLAVDYTDCAKCKGVTKSLQLGRPSRSLSSLPPDLTPPPRDVADAMEDLYPQSSTVHRASFMSRPSVQSAIGSGAIRKPREQTGVSSPPPHQLRFTSQPLSRHQHGSRQLPE
jgi:hypothetical protein